MSDVGEEKISPREVISGIPCWCRFDEAVDLVAVIENPKNPNIHLEEQIDLLSRIIKAGGWREPITVSTRSGFIVKGHGRLAAAKKLGVQEVPVEYQDYESEAAEYADLIADNRIAEFSVLDHVKVTDILNDEVFKNFDISLTGFDLGNIGMVGTVNTGDENSEWVGMPEFDQEKEKEIRLIVSFQSVQEMNEFVKQKQLRIIKKQSKVWSTRWPFEPPDDLASIRFDNVEEQNGNDDFIVESGPEETVSEEEQ